MPVFWGSGVLWGDGTLWGDEGDPPPGVPAGLETGPSLMVELGLAATTDSFVLNDTTKGKLTSGSGLGDALGYEWTDVTRYVLNAERVEINRGSTANEGPFLRYEAAHATFGFDNTDGRFDPSNLTGPYASAGVTGLRPGLPVRISGVVGGVPFTLFTGFVTAWSVEYPLAGQASVAFVDATDATSVLTAYVGPEQNLVGEGETGPARIGRVLDNAGWPDEERVIDPAVTYTFQETNLSSEAWTELQVTADSEAGYLYADRFGRINYRGRSGFPRASTTTFGVSDIPAAEVVTSYDDTQVVNRALLKVVGGDSAQQADDETAQALLQIGSNVGTGVRAYSRDDLTVEFNSQAQDLARFITGQWATLSQRVESVAVTPKQSAVDALWSRMFNLEILDRVTVEWSTPDGRTNEFDCLIRGLTIGYEDRAWRWDVSTMPAPTPLGNFELDSSEFGVLDVNTLTSF